MMTVSHPGPHFSGNRAAPKPKPHFSGKTEQQQFIEKLKGFPAATHERLEQIYHLRGKPAHIDLAHELEEKDEHIKMNTSNGLMPPLPIKASPSRSKI